MESVHGSMRFINALKLYAKLSMYVCMCILRGKRTMAFMRFSKQFVTSSDYELRTPDRRRLTEVPHPFADGTRVFYASQPERPYLSRNHCKMKHQSH